MPIINKDGSPLEDQWVLIDEPGDVPTDGDVIVPLEVALEKSDRLSNHNGRIGLLIANDVDVEDHAELIKRADLVVLLLPSFSDGRAYSQARLCREHLHYDKELRLKGDVLADQAAYLNRCGFDSFDIDGPFDAEIWQHTLGLISSSYQRGYDDKLATKPA